MYDTKDQGRGRNGITALAPLCHMVIQGYHQAASGFRGRHRVCDPIGGRTIATRGQLLRQSVRVETDSFSAVEPTGTSMNETKNNFKNFSIDWEGGGGETVRPFGCYLIDKCDISALGIQCSRSTDDACSLQRLLYEKDG